MPSIGEVHKYFNQPLCTINTTMPTHQETLLDTPIILPTTEPAEPQISYTVQQSDLPVITPNVPHKLTPFVVAAGKNVSGENRAVSYRLFKNGVPLITATSPSFANNIFWTYTFPYFYDAKVGDVLTVKLWAAGNVNFDYSAFYVYYTRLAPAKDYQILTNVSYTLATWPTLALGNPVPNITSGTVPQYLDLSLASIATNTRYPVQIQGPLYKLQRANYGDINGGAIFYTHASNRPFYARLFIPTKIEYNPTMLTLY